jgi:signal transduction histidine kinase
MLVHWNPEFAATATEQAYREWSYAETARYARLVLLVGSGAVLLLVVNDFLLAKPLPFFPLLVTARLAIFTLGLVIAVLLRRQLDYRALDASLLAWTIAVVVFNILVSLSRPVGFTLHVLINQTVVLATFLVIPLRYTHRLLCGLGGAAAYLGAMVVWRRLAVTQVVPLAVATAIAAAIGGIAAFRIERLRRLEFANLTEARRINRELAAAVADLQAFTSSVSHDLKAPLRAMRGFAAIIMEDAGGKLDEAARENLERIVKSGTRMNDLINDLLSYCRIAQQEIVPRSMDLASAIAGVIDQLPQGERIEKLKMDLPVPLPPVLGHGPTLQQVIVNLLSNARKFVPPGAEPEVTITVEKIGANIRLWFRDKGIGIPQQHQERIFQAFQRLHSQDAYPGTGIGLAIVKRGVERMGGRVGFDSEAGVGSNFWIELPVGPSVNQDIGS